MREHGNWTKWTEAAEALRPLSDPTRVGILALLRAGGSIDRRDNGGEPLGGMSVGDICDAMDLPQPTVSHHLALLRMGRVLTRQRRGKCIIYRIRSGALEDMKVALDPIVRQKWETPKRKKK